MHANKVEINGETIIDLTSDTITADKLAKGYTAHDKTGTVSVWGYGFYSASTYSKTTYSFVGDGYYTGLYYGTPTKTSATFSIGSNGRLTGLPNNLSSCDLLVVIE